MRYLFLVNIILSPVKSKTEAVTGKAPQETSHECGLTVEAVKTRQIIQFYVLNLVNWTLVTILCKTLGKWTEKALSKKFVGNLQNDIFLDEF